MDPFESQPSPEPDDEQVTNEQPLDDPPKFAFRPIEPSRANTPQTSVWPYLIGVFVVVWIFNALNDASHSPRKLRSRSLIPEIDIPPAVAWSSEALPVTPKQERGVKQLFDMIVDGLRHSDLDVLTECFDFPRMHRETLSQGADAHIDKRADGMMINSMKERLPQRLLTTWTPSGFENWDIRRCVESTDGTEICVYAVHYDEAGGREKIRWWLAYSDGRWKIYDLEDMQFGMRLSHEMAEGVKLGALRVAEGRSLQPANANTERMQAAHAAMRNNDLVNCERHLKQIQMDDVTDGLRSHCLVLQAAIDVEQGRPQRALERLREASRYNKNAPTIQLLQAGAENDLNEPRKARRTAEAYLKQVGADAGGYYQLGRAYLGMEEWEEAAENFRLALKDDPNHIESLCLLGIVLQPDEVGELRRHFNQLSKPNEGFAWLCESLLDEECYDAFQTLVAAQQNRNPKEPNGRYYLAWARKDWPEVIRLYDEELSALELDPATALRPTLMLAYHKSERSLDALERIQPTNEVFDLLARLAANDEDSKLLTQLNRRFDALDISDPRLTLWQAEVHWLEEDYAKALSLLRENRQSILAANDTEEHLVGRVIGCLLHLKRWMEAEIEAANWNRKYQDPWYLALVFATQGDPGRTLDWLDKCAEFGYDPVFFYLDPIMGPALRKAEFESVRKKYPNPIQQPLRGPSTTRFTPHCNSSALLAMLG